MIYTNDMIKQKNERKRKRRRYYKFIFFTFVIIAFLILIDTAFSVYIKKEKDIDIFGFKKYVVTTNSMQPTYNKGDLIVTKKVNIDEINENDIITYYTGNEKNTTTHRVIQISKSDDGRIQFQTKGDNNSGPDAELVNYEQIKGKVIYRLDNGGKISTKLLTGIEITIIILTVILIYLHIILKEEKRMIREEAREMYNIPKYKEDDQL